MKKLFLALLVSFFSISVFSQEINWVSIEEAETLTKKNPKKILVYIHTDWCKWCKVMNKETFSQKEIIDYMNKNFYAVKFNGEEKSEIKFNGNTYKYKEVEKKKRSYNEFSVFLTTKTTERPPYPTFVFLDEKKEIIKFYSGYKEYEEFSKILKYYGEDAYKNKTLEQYTEK